MENLGFVPDGLDHSQIEDDRKAGEDRNANDDGNSDTDDMSDRNSFNYDENFGTGATSESEDKSDTIINKTEQNEKLSDIGETNSTSEGKLKDTYREENKALNNIKDPAKENKNYNQIIKIENSCVKKHTKINSKVANDSPNDSAVIFTKRKTDGIHQNGALTVETVRVDIRKKDDSVILKPMDLIKQGTRLFYLPSRTFM